MKLQHTVFLWNTNDRTKFKVFPIGEVDLSLFNSEYTADGAVHESFRMMTDLEALDYFEKMIEVLMHQGHNLRYLHFHFLGVDGYDLVLKRIIDKSNGQ